MQPTNFNSSKAARAKSTLGDANGNLRLNLDLLERNKTNGTNMSYDPRQSFREILTQKNHNKSSITRNFGNLYASIGNYTSSYNANTSAEADSATCTI